MKERERNAILETVALMADLIESKVTKRGKRESDGSV
jgi:hypothetical protein